MKWMRRLRPREEHHQRRISVCMGELVCCQAGNVRKLLWERNFVSDSVFRILLMLNRHLACGKDFVRFDWVNWWWQDENKKTWFLYELLLQQRYNFNLSVIYDWRVVERHPYHSVAYSGNFGIYLRCVCTSSSL